MSSTVGVLRADELDRILLRSKASNAASWITGLLLLHEGTFLQVIEGSPAGVLGLMQRIRRDRRHSGLVLLESHACLTRAFASSPMAYVAPRNLTPGQRHEFSDLIAVVAQRRATDDVERLTGQVWSFLSSFRECEAA
jgi:hypothetical protein